MNPFAEIYDRFYDALQDYRLRKLVRNPAVLAATFGVNSHAGPTSPELQAWYQEQVRLDCESRLARNIFLK